MEEKLNFFNEKIILKNLNLVPNFIKKRKKNKDGFIFKNHFF